MNVVGDEFFGAENDAAETAALAVDVLRGGINDAVRSKRQRLLK